MSRSLPGAPFLARLDQRLMLEDHPLADLARRYGTPLYVYSSNAMRTAAAGNQRALAGRPHLL